MDILNCTVGDYWAADKRVYISYAYSPAAGTALNTYQQLNMGGNDTIKSKWLNTEEVPVLKVPWRGMDDDFAVLRLTLSAALVPSSE